MSVDSSVPSIPPRFDSWHRLLTHLNASGPLLKKLEQVAITAAELTNSNHAEVVLEDPLMRRYIGSGSGRVCIRQPHDEAARWISEHRRPLVVPDLNFASSMSELALQERDIASYMGVPIARQRTILGALLIFNKEPRSYDRDETRTLEALAALTALAVTARQATDELEDARRTLLKLSLTDPMTGVATRNQFLHMLRREWRRATHEGLSIAVLELEIDNFDNFVETHNLGDAWRILSSAAKTLHGALYRAGDLVARIDDTKLVALLPETDLESAEAIAQRLRREVTATTPSLNGAPLTLSVGVASFDTLLLQQGVMSSPETLLERAEQALGKAKSEGGNRVELM